MANTMVLINSYNLQANQTTVTFNTIPQTYTDLLLLVSSRCTANFGIGNIVSLVTINSTSSGFSSKRLYGGPTTGSDGANSNGTTWGFQVVPAQGTTNAYGNAKIYIPNYTSSTAKCAFIDSVSLAQTTAWESDLIAWSSGVTAPISSIALTPSGGDWTAYSTFYLYGIKNS